MMRTYLLHAMGDDFGPFSFDHVSGKIIARELAPSQSVSIVEDGIVVIRFSTLGQLSEFRDAVARAQA